MLTNGEVSINKLARVVSIATAVRDEKRIATGENNSHSKHEPENENGSNKPHFEGKSLPGQNLTF